MVSKQDTLFKYYDVVGIESGNFIARFMSKKEALLAKKWLNEEVFGCEYAKLETKNVSYQNIWQYQIQHIPGVTYSSAKEFILHIRKKADELTNAKFYQCKPDNLAFVKIDNFWWELDTKTPLNKATVYNRFGGRQTGLDLSNSTIVEAKDWQHLDWLGTSVYDNAFTTGWLSPQGKFFGCSYSSHNSQAELVHGKPESQLEAEGWIKLTRNIGNERQLVAYAGRDKFNNYIAPTHLQFEYLQKCALYNYGQIKCLYEQQFIEDMQL